MDLPPNLSGPEGVTGLPTNLDTIVGVTGATCSTFFSCAEQYIIDSNFIEGPFNPNPNPQNLPTAREVFNEIADIPSFPTETLESQAETFTKGLADRNMSYTYLAIGILFLIIIMIFYFSQLISLTLAMFIVIGFVFALYFIFVSFRATVTVWSDQNTSAIAETINTFENDLNSAIRRVPTAFANALCVYENKTLCGITGATFESNGSLGCKSDICQGQDVVGKIKLEREKDQISPNQNSGKKTQRMSGMAQKRREEVIKRRNSNMLNKPDNDENTFNVDIKDYKSKDVIVVTS